MEELEEQSENKPGRADHLKPWQYKKGQSGNPGGRPVGSISMKQYVKNKLLSMTNEEREEFLNGVDKKIIWEMAEDKAGQGVQVSGGLTISQILDDLDE